MAGFFVSAILLTVRTVIWPSSVATHAEVWRVLDLAGLSSSVRNSRNYLKSGFVYLDGTPVMTLRDCMELGKLHRLELRFPNGVIVGDNIWLVRPTPGKPRNNMATVLNRKY